MMKRVLFLLTALIGAATTMAQDLIVKSDSTRIEAQVNEITPEVIRYKRFARPNGPTYVLPVKEICYIRYADGFIEDYNRVAAPQPTVMAEVAPTPAPAPAPTPTPAPVTEPQEVVTPPVSKEVAPQPLRPNTPNTAGGYGVDYNATSVPVETRVVQPNIPNQPGGYGVDYNYSQPREVRYTLGQYYDHNGLRGIVCALNDDRTHGLLLSLDEVMVEWSVFRKGNLVEIGAAHSTDGRENMAAVARYIEQTNGKWEDFPAFKWCRDLGEGWYLPSVDELLMIGNNYNGGSRRSNDRKMRLFFNDNLKMNGGKRINAKGFYYSSTEVNDRLAILTHMGLEAPYVMNINSSEEIPKHTKWLVRAVHPF